MKEVPNYKEQILKEVDEIKDKLYPTDTKKGYSFCHWILKNIYELSDDEAKKSCYVGGSNDLTVDAVYYDDDEDTKEIFIVQTKFLQNQPVKRDDVAAFYKIVIDSVLKNGKYVQNKGNSMLKTEARNIFSKLTEQNYKVRLKYYTFSNFSDYEYNDELTKQAADIKEYSVHFKAHNLSDINREFYLIKLKDKIFKGKLKYSLKGGFLTFQTDDAKAIIFNIGSDELLRDFRNYYYQLVQLNLRYKLKSKINTKIIQSLNTDDGKTNFWFYNNGIYITCKSFKLLPNEKNAKFIEIEDLQIVNGCQTTTTLEEAGKLKDVYLLCRVVQPLVEEEQENKEFLNKIAERTNSQNPIKPRDLRANDPVQQRLHEEFLVETNNFFSNRWYYERKGGEFEAAKRLESIRPRDYTKIDNRKLIKSFIAFYGNPSAARSNVDNLFDLDEPYYKKVFPLVDKGNISINSYFFPFFVLYKAEEKRKQKQKTYFFLKDADLYVVSAFAYLLFKLTNFKRIEEETDDEMTIRFLEQYSKIFTGLDEKEFDEFFDFVYNKLLDIFDNVVDAEMSACEKSKTIYNNSNFFKKDSTWLSLKEKMNKRIFERGEEFNTLKEKLPSKLSS